jgi:hypothetical protein
VTHIATEDDDEGHRHYRLQVSVPADLPGQPSRDGLDSHKRPRLPETPPAAGSSEGQAPLPGCDGSDASPASLDHRRARCLSAHLGA